MPKEQVHEIKPLTLNMTLSMYEGVVSGELRKTFTVKEENLSFWKKLFMYSLENKEIEIKARIVFRDNFKSTCTLFDYGIINEKERQELIEKIKKQE